MATLDDIIAVQQQGVQYLGLILKELQASHVLNFVPVPATATDPGTPGQVACNTTHLYVCVANSTWRRVAISSF